MTLTVYFDGEGFYNVETKTPIGPWSDIAKKVLNYLDIAAQQGDDLDELVRQNLNRGYYYIHKPDEKVERVVETKADDKIGYTRPFNFRIDSSEIIIPGFQNLYREGYEKGMKDAIDFMNSLNKK